MTVLEKLLKVRGGRIYVGPNENMKLLIARGLFKELYQQINVKRKNNIMTNYISVLAKLSSTFLICYI